jgi:hypothetical protein
LQASAAPEQPVTVQLLEQHPAPQAAATMADVVKAAIVTIRTRKDSSNAEVSDTAAPGNASDTQRTQQQKQQQKQLRKLAGNQSPAHHLKANMKQAGTSKPSFLKVAKAVNATSADSKLQLKGSNDGKAVAAAGGAGKTVKAKASATKFKVTSGAGKIKVLYRGT